MRELLNIDRQVARLENERLNTCGHGRRARLDERIKHLNAQRKDSVSAYISLDGMGRQVATEMMEALGFRVEHRTDHRVIWTNSKIFNAEGDKIGNITPASTNTPLTITLILQLLSAEQAAAVYDLVNNRLMPEENKGS